jgi:hypothetical protein
MEVNGTYKKDGEATTFLSRGSALTNTSSTGSNGRARISLRVSAVGSECGFEGTALQKAWVTVEASEELPHANTPEARDHAFTECIRTARAQLDEAFEFLLASTTVEEEDIPLLKLLLDSPSKAKAQGVPETWLRALQASPVKVWQSLTSDEKKELRGCYA